MPILRKPFHDVEEVHWLMENFASSAGVFVFIFIASAIDALPVRQISVQLLLEATFGFSTC